MAVHRVDVVRLARIDPHPNADRMEIAAVRGWSCCVGKGQFAPGDLAAIGRVQFTFVSNAYRERA